LPRLRGLSLGSNQLSGSIPSELGNLTELKLFNVYNNQLSGNIPEELGDLTKLEYLILGRNPLDGQLPQSLLNLKNLYEFHINGTNVCQPTDKAYRTWYGSIRGRNKDHNNLYCQSPNELPQTGDNRNYLAKMLTISGILCLLIGLWMRQRSLSL
jgi:hypothetical protein